MSESSEDKTRRKILKLLTDHPWSRQYSIFYKNREDSENLIRDLPRFKKELRRKFATIPFLLQTRLYKPKGSVKPFAYVTIFTIDTIHFSKFEEIADSVFDHPVRAVTRYFREEKKISTLNKIKTQKLHNLSGFFNTKKINRIHLLNKEFLSNI